MHRSGRRGVWAIAVLACAGVLAAAPQGASAAAGTVTEFTVPTTDSFPLGITAGPDGKLWFTEQNKRKIARITTAGSIAPTDEFLIPTVGAVPTSIAPGADGKLWFTEDSINKIGRITTAGAIDDFTITTPSAAPQAIAPGPDGNLWFTEGASPGKVARMTTDAVPTITEFPTPTVSSPGGIVAGPDGNMWFTQSGANKIGRITTGATPTITEFPIPTVAASPRDIATGPDGNLWFTEGNKNQIGRITPAGAVTEFPIPTAGTSPRRIAPGPDGNLWFTEQNGDKVGRITPTGGITEFPIPTPDPQTGGITAGPDGNVWFTEFNQNKVARITTALGPPQFSSSTPITTPGTAGNATPYPSEISVSGVEGPVTSVRLRLLGLSHSRPDDLDILLVGPQGQKVLVMSDAGGLKPGAVSEPINIADSAGFALPDDAPLVTGLYKPANYDAGNDLFPGAPAGPYATSLSEFAGKDPNGTWQLYVRDDTDAATGRLAGWGLDIQTPAPPNGGGGGGEDIDAPETTIDKGPKRKTKKRKAKFRFSSDEPGSSFMCKLDKKEFAPCDAKEKFKVKRRKHKLRVEAIDAAGNVDPTPALHKWKVKKKRKR
jgi:streptogramin lyase/subtilisin-like proprotein convertase family protein